MYSNLVYKSSTRGSRFPIIPTTNVLSMADTTNANIKKYTDEHQSGYRYAMAQNRTILGTFLYVKYLQHHASLVSVTFAYRYSYIAVKWAALGFSGS